MAVMTGSWLVDILLLTCSLLGIIFWYLTSTAGYFKERGIPFLKPTLILGYKGMFTLTQMELSKTLYNQFPGERFFGYFQFMVPTLLIKDPDLVHRIMVKDFTHFQDHGFKSFERDLLSKNLFNLKGQTWRSLRMKLIPAFTTGKLKVMFSQLEESGDHLLKEIEDTSLSGKPAEAKDLLLTFSSEVIGSTAFGLDISKGNPQTVEFLSRVNKIFKTGFTQLIAFFLLMCAPKIANCLRLTFYKTGVQDYFFDLVKASKSYRRQNKIERNDFFQILLSLQEEEKTSDSTAQAVTDEDDEVINQLKHISRFSPTDKKLLTDEDVAGQAVGLLMGGTDTTSGTISFALYHIAKDPQVQKRVVEELRLVLGKHGWTYQAMKEMTYLDQVLQETLRLYPILPINFRECTTPYQIPDSNVTLEKGTIVAIPVVGIHYDPEFYPDPNTFNPERFKDNNHKPSSTYMPFGDGPRICIGLRFAVLEMKLCLAKVLFHYSVDVDSKTAEPLTFDIASFIPKLVGGIWINFKEREK